MTLRKGWMGMCLGLLACGSEGAAPPPYHPGAPCDAGSMPDAASGTHDDAGGHQPEPPKPSHDAAVPAPDAAQTTDAAADAEGPGELPDLPGWSLIWHDEFDGPAGEKPSAERWQFETGGHGFGNNQLEYNTDRAENAAQNGQGLLVITARREEYMGNDYTSVRLNTRGKFEHRYGRYETRMRLPQGQGMWPAFWMLGVDIGSAGWPSCGEIDIMENIGREPSTVHGTLHGPGYSGGNGIGAGISLEGGARFADDFHVFTIEWEENEVRWYLDGELYQTRRPSDLPGGARWVYDHDFFLLLNLAVGGQWPGNPDGSTQFPQELRVDYVRVYERD